MQPSEQTQPVEQTQELQRQDLEEEKIQIKKQIDEGLREAEEKKAEAEGLM